MIVRLAVLSLCLILTSCGAQWHLNRAIAKDPTILKPVKVDTTVVTRTLTVRDTVVNLKDTVIVRENVVTSVEYRDSLVYIETICPPDTVEISVPFETIVYREDAKSVNNREIMNF